MRKKEYLTLQLGSDLREEIAYNNHAIPFSICIDHFDDYLNCQWPTHWHDEYEFVLVLHGSVIFTVCGGGNDSTDIVLSEGDGLFIGSACLHSAKAMPGTVAAGYVFSNAFFNMKPFEKVLRELLQPITDAAITYIKFEKEAASAEHILQTLSNLCHLPEDETGHELHCVELVLKLWRLLLQYILINESQIPRRTIEDSKEQRLKALVSYIHAHYSEPVTVETMAKHIGISRTECFRCFQSILRKTPVEYLTGYRLSMAASLLVNTQRTVSDIAESCGFPSQSYFGKLFRTHYGKTPKEYQKMSKGHLIV